MPFLSLKCPIDWACGNYWLQGNYHSLRRGRGALIWNCLFFQSGLIRTDNGEFFIEPLEKGQQDVEVKGRVHVVYRRSAIKKETGQQRQDLHNEGGRGVWWCQWKHKGLCTVVCVSWQCAHVCGCGVLYMCSASIHLSSQNLVFEDMHTLHALIYRGATSPRTCCAGLDMGRNWEKTHTDMGETRKPRTKDLLVESRVLTIVAHLQDPQFNTISKAHTVVFVLAIITVQRFWVWIPASVERFCMWL